MEVVGIAAAIIPLGGLVRLLLVHPQRGVLLLAALAPFDGLLLLLNLPEALDAWKEALVIATLGATFVAPPSARNQTSTPLPGWLLPAFGLFLIAAVSALGVMPQVAVAGFKIDFFYLLLTFAIWRCPLDGHDRDRLVTILMVGGVTTSIVGIGQQIVGADRLNEIGYEFNTVIRTAGDSVLRAFSTFELPFPFAFYVVFVLAVASPVALREPSRPRNTIFLLSTPIMVAGIATAVVRAALLALAVSVLYHLIRNYRAVLSLLPVSLLLFVVAPAAAVSAALSASSLGERFDGWSVVADTVIANPFGTGIGTTGSAAEVAVGLGGEIDETFGLPPDLLPYQPDNFYLKRLLELGPIGLWLTVAFMRHVVATARSARSKASPVDIALLDGWIAAVLGALAAAAVATYWEIFPLDLFFYLMLGVTTSIERAGSPSPPSPSSQEGLASRPTLLSY